jgi:energy-coupling factor transporter ATP-binding protein EcfA2
MNDTRHLRTSIRLEACAKTFADGTRALEPITLDITGGETVVFLGPSGCGKTTTLRIIAGIESPDPGGRIYFDDEDVTELGNLLRKQPQVCRILCGHVHRPIHTQWNGLSVSIAPSASHYVALDLGKEPPREFYLEPPSIHLHSWHDHCLVTHLSFVGQFAGPYPFYDELGRLID